MKSKITPPHPFPKKKKEPELKKKKKKKERRERIKVVIIQLVQDTDNKIFDLSGLLPFIRGIENASLKNKIRPQISLLFFVCLFFSFRYRGLPMPVVVRSRCALTDALVANSLIRLRQ